MNNKQLAEMIKRLRKEKLDDLAMTDINTTSHMKGAGHDIVEYQVRAAATSPQLTKTPTARKYAIDSRNQPKGGNDVTGRYKPSVRTEEKVDKKSKAKNIINTEPEQDSAMIGTQ